MIVLRVLPVNALSGRFCRELVAIAGPICESGDVLGSERVFPLSTSEGDVVLVDCIGAYGRCMASAYNLRDPGDEIII
eukprot:m.511552 g.511552  ORF g.511552 m.511552 type:complete len:78 (-) comp57426_c0_seq5:42-275(-)